LLQKPTIAQCGFMIWKITNSPIEHFDPYLNKHIINQLTNFYALCPFIYQKAKHNALITEYWWKSVEELLLGRK
jgi:hypothetical protein